MLNSISSFILKDNAPIQITLHSIPVVNLIVMLFQKSHSLDFFNGRALSQQNIDAYDHYKQRHISYMTRGLLLQGAIAIASLALSILFPQRSIESKVAFITYCIFGTTALSAFLYDKFTRSYLMLPQMSSQDLTVTGF
ncbi:MAG: hypothetical protein H0V82_09365 [Candidatus Protochlamydia sp.]|nr:hypothetical protein [Candidatus Protochlamydia sp.]